MSKKRPNDDDSLDDEEFGPILPKRAKKAQNNSSDEGHDTNDEPANAPDSSSKTEPSKSVAGPPKPILPPKPVQGIFEPEDDEQNSKPKLSKSQIKKIQGPKEPDDTNKPKKGGGSLKLKGMVTKGKGKRVTYKSAKDKEDTNTKSVEDLLDARCKLKGDKFCM